MLQGTQRKVLETIADIQRAISVEVVEDGQIAEEIDLDVGLVRNALEVLAEAGYVRLEKEETLAGKVYSTYLTGQGKAALKKETVSG